MGVHFFPLSSLRIGYVKVHRNLNLEDVLLHKYYNKPEKYYKTENPRLNVTRPEKERKKNRRGKSVSFHYPGLLYYFWKIKNTRPNSLKT